MTKLKGNKIYSALNSQYAIGLSYLVILGLFYLQYPIKNSYPGDFDTWGNLAMFKEMLLALEALINGVDYGSFLFNNHNTWVDYGLDFFTGFVWIIFYKLGMNEIWSYWAYITILLTSNSIALYVFSKHFIKDRFLRWTVGLAFSVHFFVYLTIDNPNILSYCFFFISLNQLFYFFEKLEHKFFFRYCLFSGIQLYFAPVVFVFLFFVSGFLFLYYLRRVGLQNLKSVFWSLLFLLLLISPYIFLFLIPNQSEGFVESLGAQQMILYNNNLAFKWADIFRLYPDHYFYIGAQDLNYRFLELKHLFPGFVIFGLFIASFLTTRKWQFHYLLLLIFILGNGEYLYISESFQLKSPFYPVFHSLGLTKVLRNPSRLHLVVLFSYLIIVFQFLDELLSRKKIGSFWIYAITFLCLIESSLYSKKSLNESIFLEVYERNVFEGVLFSSDDVILSIPTGNGGQKEVREMLYMNQRIFQKTNIINGVQISNYSSLHFPTLGVDFCQFLISKNINRVVLYADLVFDEIDVSQIREVIKCDCLSKEKIAEKTYSFRFLEKETSNDKSTREPRAQIINPL